MRRAEEREAAADARRKAEIEAEAKKLAAAMQAKSAAAPASADGTSAAAAACAIRSRAIACRGRRGGTGRGRLEWHRGQDRHAVLSGAGFLSNGSRTAGARRRARLHARRRPLLGMPCQGTQGHGWQDRLRPEARADSDQGQAAFRRCRGTGGRTTARSSTCAFNGRMPRMRPCRSSRAARWIRTTRSSLRS